jgi:hypothetical protein
LVCGFCAVTGLEISLTKVEAVSLNHLGISHDTPFLTLRDWNWRPHLVVHRDDGYWIRYLGLFLDTGSCAKHFRMARLKLQQMCRVLMRKVAPPSAKRLVYTLCLKSQMRYPAGLAPWTTAQYDALDKIPTPLFRQIYGLRRSFPADLIYAPEDVGGCGESRLSDIAQLQKWHYLNSVAHLGQGQADTVTALIQRAQHALVTDPSFYCSSLVAWGKRMGLTLHQAPASEIPHALSSFLTAASTGRPRKCYSDGSFALHASLLDTLTLSPSDLTRQSAVAATGIYLPPSLNSEALALVIHTPCESATDAYYQELLGV